MEVYLDNAATTKAADEVISAMQPYFAKVYGNPSSLHSFGKEAKKALESSRERIANHINADIDEIIFTSGGTESNNLALQEAAYTNKGRGNHIITSKIEHHSVLNTCEFLERDGFNLTYLDVDKNGLVDIGQLKESITKETILVSIMHANNEIGTIQPIDEIGELCKKRGVIFHTDAVQTFGKIPIDVKKIGIDLLSASGHKIHGPKGIGFLYVKRGVKINPMQYGGNHELGLRPGTENIPAIVGFAKSVQLCDYANKEAVLRDKLINEVLKIANTRLNGNYADRLPGNAHFLINGIEGETLLLHLDEHGIAVSTGSACSSYELRPSHVLKAIGLKPGDSLSSIRITLSRYTTEKEIDYTIRVLKEVVERLRKKINK